MRRQDKFSRFRDLGDRPVPGATLGAIGSADFIPQLLESLVADKDLGVRNSCAKALGKIGDESAVAPLKKALNDESDYVRNAAFEALEKISRRLGKRIAQSKALEAVGRKKSLQVASCELRGKKKVR